MLGDELDCTPRSYSIANFIGAFLFSIPFLGFSFGVTLNFSHLICVSASICARKYILRRSGR